MLTANAPFADLLNPQRLIDKVFQQVVNQLNNLSASANSVGGEREVYSGYRDLGSSGHGLQGLAVDPGFGQANEVGGSGGSASENKTAASENVPQLQGTVNGTLGPVAQHPAQKDAEVKEKVRSSQSAGKYDVVSTTGPANAAPQAFALKKQESDFKMLHGFPEDANKPMAAPASPAFPLRASRLSQSWLSPSSHADEAPSPYPSVLNSQSLRLEGIEQQQRRSQEFGSQHGHLNVGGLALLFFCGLIGLGLVMFAPLWGRKKKTEGSIDGDQSQTKRED